MEETMGLGQRDEKGTTNDIFLFVSWFSSKRLVEAAMDIGADMVGMVKNNTQLFYKDTL